MKSTRPAHTRPPSDDVVNQAAEWIVRLSDDDLTLADLAALQAEFEQWQEISPHHAEAARKMLTVIDQSKWIRATAHPASAHAAMEASLAKKRRNMRARKLSAMLILIAALALPARVFFQYYPPAYLLADVRTSIGQWHTQALADNSHIMLNTASAANFHFDTTERKLELVRGEILVEVATDPLRPFIGENPPWPHSRTGYAIYHPSGQRDDHPDHAGIQSGSHVARIRQTTTDW